MTRKNRESLTHSTAPRLRREFSRTPPSLGRGKIPDLKQPHGALKEAEERYQRVFEDSKDMVYMTSADGKLAEVNQAGVELLGYGSKEEMMQVYARDTFLSPEDQKRFMNEVIKEGFVRDFEVKLKRKDGTQIDVLITANARRGDSGEIISYDGIIKDITDRKRMQDELKNSEERFKQVAENAGEWIWEVDASGLYTYASPVVKKILGYEPEEVVGKKHFYDSLAPDERENLKKAAFDVFARKETFRNFVNANIHKNGSMVILETSGTPILDDKRNLLGYRGLDTDITYRKRMEEELVQRTKDLEALNEMGALINQSLDLDRVFHVALEKAVSLTGFEEGAIYLANDKEQILERKYDLNPSFPLPNAAKVLKYGEGVSGKAFSSKQPVVVSIDEYLSHRKSPALIKEGIQTLVGFPLLSKGKAIGTITLFSHSRRELSQREINLLESIGSQIGLALENARLFSTVAKAKSEWETTFDAVTDLLTIRDKDYRIIRANKAAFERFGLETGRDDRKAVL